jgi:hypothetical protein
MSYEEYSKKKHRSPYLLKLKSGKNFFYYFGEKHSYNPNDSQWEELKDFWSEFLEKTKDTKKIVFIEEGIRSLESNENDAVLKHGGMGLITFLANKENIEVFSPEPEEKWERCVLSKLLLGNKYNIIILPELLDSGDINKIPNLILKNIWENSYEMTKKRVVGMISIFL